ncbi:MAG: hypothetical protein PF961_20030 [Planctomycetota bacterium]|nr:hypothetical protein [Planctomycetota bacterium]
MGIGATAYADDEQGRLPSTNTTEPKTWIELIDPYIGSADAGSHQVQRGVAWGCPAWEGYSPAGSGNTKTGYGATPYLDLPDSWANNAWNTAAWGAVKRDFVLGSVRYASSHILYGDCHDHHLVELVKDLLDNYRPPTSVVMPGKEFRGERHGNRSNVVYANFHCATVSWEVYRSGLQPSHLQGAAGQSWQP